MYYNVSSNNSYPKTLYIYNNKNGVLWQIYHVESQREADSLSKNATGNGSQHIKLGDYNEKLIETFPDWRTSPGGKKIINS
jgi:hypothetical protein